MHLPPVRQAYGEFRQQYGTLCSLLLTTAFAVTMVVTMLVKTVHRNVFIMSV